MTAVKICGISDPKNLAVAIEASARYIGFNFYAPSPRYVSFDIAWTLAQQVPTGVRSVGLFVDPSNEELDRIATGIQFDMIQLHGDEGTARVAEIKAKYAMPVMKAIRVREAVDLKNVAEYEAVADYLLFDSKPEQATLPGGTGHKFDWSLLKGRTFTKPWMLGGGLNAENINDALSQLSPDALDVSSGVESAPGVKDADKIRAFIEETKRA